MEQHQLQFLSEEELLLVQDKEIIPLNLHQKGKRVALFSALSSKLKDGEIKIISGLEKLEPKTKKWQNVKNKTFI